MYSIKIKNKDNLTIVVGQLVLHDLALAAAVADRLIVMSEGTTSATGVPEEVLSSQLIAEVWGVEAELVHRQGRSGLHVEWLDTSPELRN